MVILSDLKNELHMVQLKNGNFAKFQEEEMYQIIDQVITTMDMMKVREVTVEQLKIGNQGIISEKYTIGDEILDYAL